MATQLYRVADLYDYANVAKFFAGEYNAKIRTSHSMLYGFVHAPLIFLFHSFFIMKLTSLLFLILIIISVYFISNKDKRTLLLLMASPIIWYMGPWINSIQLASLLFLWGFFFFSKFNKDGKSIHLIYSGILIGLSWAFWNSIMFFLFFFIICFFYNKNINLLAIFIFSVLVGISPLLLLDQILYGFPFYSLIKFFSRAVTSSIYGSIYQGQGTLVARSFANYIAFLIIIPFFSYTLFSKKFFKQNKRIVIFLTFCFLFLLVNPQIRYLLFLWPMLMLYLPKNLTQKQFKIQFIIFLIISLLVINPYIIQTKYSTNTYEFSSLFSNIGNWKINQVDIGELVKEDLNEIIKDYPNEIFVIGNKAEDYRFLAYLYWGENVKEFVSIQDYNLYLKNDTTLFEKKIKFIPKIKDRRQIWLAGGMDKNENDETEYEKITLGIGVEEPIEIEGFEPIKKFNSLYLSEKKDFT